MSIRHGESEPIIQLMTDMDLQSLLPRGTATWHCHNGELRSTIDLVLVTPELASEVVQCTTEHIEHDSDHQAIRTKLTVEVVSQTTQVRKLWKKTDWE
jgi:endonuclease/exonuclease/phosphatase family metal-dependent hydrolase